MLASDPHERIVFLGYGELFTAEKKQSNRKIAEPSSLDGLAMDEECCYTSKGGTLTVLSLPGGKKLRSFPIDKWHRKFIANRITDPASGYAGLIYAGYKDRIVLYNTKAGAEPETLWQGGWLDFDVRGDLLAVSLEDRTVRICRGGRPLCALTLEDTPAAVSFDRDADMLYIGTDLGRLLGVCVENAESPS